MTSVDVDERAAGENVGVSAKHELELVGGRRVLLLDDGGWASSAGWERTSEKAVRKTARVVVGPDEPVDGQSPAEAEAEHWAHLASAALRQGVSVSASELEHLPHDVEFDDRLLLHLNTG
ncbi:hypothetical protein E1202_10165 [Saccharopolyspora karakumensis]|uniref:Uncharacterized protein n=1 Tax=Saccharopolyspora karakumensis TaxID=2530386 RepID=A0A4R5BU53_9PSEU|nr:hypothetical protein [Saccharopolyspora karakumensis]TDD89645.1 hypothetical protein E1202_10165 [Saccharopolyspora karakumensis]